MFNAMILCETSGEIRRRVNSRNNWSCCSVDLLPADDDGEGHAIHDAMDILFALPDNSVDLIVAHPPCTALAVSGNRWYGTGQPNYNQRLEAAEWTSKLWDHMKRVGRYCALENPVGVLNRLGSGFPKPTYVQPWQFGHGETKKTGLWLHNLPPLQPTDVVDGRENRVWYMSPSETRWKERSKTYPGIVAAIADQWCDYIEVHNG